jgi:hypothetical protein
MEITHLLFPTRYIPYKRKLSRDPTAYGPTRSDRARLERWIAHVNKNNVGDHPITAEMFEFSVMKGEHPDIDGYVVGF